MSRPKPQRIGINSGDKDMMKLIKILGTEGLLPGITGLLLTNVIRPENTLKTKEKLLGTEPEVYVWKAPLESPVFKAESANHISPKLHSAPFKRLLK